MAKICHISTVHPAFDTRIFYKECKTLVKAGYEVYLIVTHDREDIIDGVHIIPLPERKGRFYRFLVKDWLALSKAIKVNADIYHFHDPELIFVGLILKLFRKKVVYDIHEDYRTSILLKNWIPSYLKRFVSRILRLFEEIGINTFDGIVFAEKYYKKLFSVEKKKAIDLLNYPIISNISTRNGSSVLILRKKAFKLIYSGNVNEARGVFNIVNSFVELSKVRADVDLYLIGYTPIEVFNRINEILLKEHLTDRVLILGKNRYIKREIIDAYYNYMDIGLALIPPNPHYTNKLLTKFYEYMQYGLPIVASDFPVWREFLHHNKCGITVNPGDPVNVAKTIIYLLENEEERRSMGKNGKRLIMEQYNWEIESRKLLYLYKELLK